MQFAFDKLRSTMNGSYKRSFKVFKILNDCQPLKPVIQRTLACVIYYGFCMYMMSIMAVVSGMRYPKEKRDLPDLGFDIIPVLDNQRTTIPNNMLLVATIGAAIRLLFHDKGLTILRRYLIVHGTTALLRCLCMVATSYPDPNRECEGYHPPGSELLFWQETVVREGFLTCGDLMFSGHTLVYILVALMWTKYFTKWETPFVWVIMLFAVVSLIATRMHYTNDVLVALYVVCTVWWFYHYMAENAAIRDKNPIIKWMEIEYTVQADYERKEKEESLLKHPKEDTVELV